MVNLRYIALLLVITLSACSEQTENNNQTGSGSIAPSIIWLSRDAVNNKTTADDINYAAIAVGSGTTLPADLVTVRIIVSGSGIATPIQKDFAAAARTGTVSNIPSGNGRTVTAQGLNASGIVIYEGIENFISISSNSATPVAITAIELVNPSTTNQEPTANAGIDQSAGTGSTVTLAGGGSDTDGTITNYSWSQINGTTVTIAGSNTANASFTAPTVTTDTSLTFRLTVTDNGDLSATDDIIITITPDIGASVVSKPLNDTGIGWGANYSLGNNASCIGETIAEQDCSHGRDVTFYNDADGHAGFSFIKIDSNGDVLPVSAIFWACVLDNVTGLMWEVKTSDAGLRDKDWTYSWYNSNASINAGVAGTTNGGTCFDSTNCDTEKYVVEVNAIGLCGYNDWRLPNKETLRSIVNYESINPVIDSNWFPNTQSSHYWSATPYAYGLGGAWRTSFNNGYNNYGDRSDSNYVRLVRSGQ